MTRDSIASTIQRALDGEAVESIGTRLGTDPEQTTKAVQVTLPVLLGAIARNASSRRGARALHRAVERDHDGSVLDGFGRQVGGMDLDQGQAILRHVFGGNQQHVQQALGGKLGLSSETIGELLKILGPLVLGAIAKKMGGGQTGPGRMGREMRREERDVQHRQPDIGDLINDVLGAGKDGQGQPMGGCLPMGGR